MTRAEEIAWAAGLFEGEGCFSGPRRRGREHLRGYRQIVAVLSTTDADVLRRFELVVGMGRVRPLTPQQPHHKAAWEWKVSREVEVRALFALFEPYLGERRRARALELFRECGTLHAEQLRF